ncbi:hypothetical protein [Agromyces laixinhei]|nr:hypothetical protein [Agromyces laixinhei]
MPAAEVIRRAAASVPATRFLALSLRKLQLSSRHELTVWANARRLL